MAETPRPVCVLMLRTPVPMSEGTDSYHDAFGSFCLPSFASSALESGSSTPLTPQKAVGESEVRERLEGGRLVRDETWLMTHHRFGGDDGREFCVTSFPILGHRTLHLDELAQRIERAAVREEAFDGVVITSQRAVQAWKEASERVRHARALDPFWTKIPFYAVGPATANALRNAGAPPPLMPTVVLGGEDAGTGEALAHFVAKLCEGRPPQRLLYLVGDKHSSAFEDTLRALNAEIYLDTLCVYETCRSAALEDHCATLAHSLPGAPSRRRMTSRSSNDSLSDPGRFVHPVKRRALASLSEIRGSAPVTPPADADPGATSAVADEGPAENENAAAPSTASPGGEPGAAPPDSLPSSVVHPDWIVFFSPSGGNYALPQLQARGWLPREGAPGPAHARIACIGPSTAKWVNSTLGREPDAVAAKPNPTALRDAIVAAI